MCSFKSKELLIKDNGTINTLSDVQLLTFTSLFFNSCFWETNLSIYFSNMTVKQDRNKIPENNATSTDIHLRKDNWKACPENKYLIV